MFEPIRGGTRGGQAEFKWSDVSADKDREHYLGHSINAPTGRWQKNKDVHWYSRDLNGDSDAEEMRRVKEAEAEAMSVALGFAPTKGAGTSSSPTAGSPTTGTGANAVPVVTGAMRPMGPAPASTPIGPDARMAEKEEKRRRKEEKRAAKEERRAAKEERRAMKAARGAERDGRDRSQSPRPRLDRTPERRRSRSPPPRDASLRSHSSGRRDDRERGTRRRRSYSRERTPRAREEYDQDARDRERERDRRRWEDSARREAPDGARWGRER